MSREVDLEKPLSDDDRRYLLERNRDQDVINNDARFSGEDYSDPADQGGDQASSATSSEGENAPVDDYESLTKPQLQSALDSRGVDYKAGDDKATLINLLREDDKNRAEAGEEQDQADAEANTDDDSDE